jgi:hypothetical protein
MRHGVFILAAALIAAPLAAAYADVTIISETTGADGVASARTMYLTADRIKVDWPKRAEIFEIGAAKMVSVSIMKEEKEYYESEIDIKALDARTDSIAMMKQKAPSLIGGAIDLPAPGPIVTSFEKTGESKSIGAWPCEMFEQKRNGQLVAALCIAKADAVGLISDDLTMLRKLTETMNKTPIVGLAGNFAVLGFHAETKQIGFTEIPVEITRYLGRSVFTTTLKSVDHAPIAADIFAIPAGHARKDIPVVTIGQ